MITFSMDFNSGDFERAMYEQLEEQIRSQLTGAGLSNLKIAINRDSTLVIEGSDADVAKAKKVLEL